MKYSMNTIEAVRSMSSTASRLQIDAHIAIVIPINAGHRMNTSLNLIFSISIRPAAEFVCATVLPDCVGAVREEALDGAGVG